MVEEMTGKTAFDYVRLMENTDDKRHMCGLVVRESERELEELEHALKGMDRIAMRKIVHRMMPVWELLGADDILSVYRNVLHDRTADAVVTEHTRRIMELIRVLIDGARKELKKAAE